MKGHIVRRLLMVGGLLWASLSLGCAQCNHLESCQGLNSSGKAGQYLRDAIKAQGKGDAMRLCTKAIEADPRSACAYYQRGLIRNGNGEYDQAIEDFGRAIALDDRFAVAVLDRGRNYYFKGNYTAALEDALRARQMNPQMIYAYHVAGSCCDQLGRFDEAMAIYNELIRLQPNEAEAYNSRGYTLFHARRYEEALRDLNHSITLQPNNNNLSSRGELYHAQKRYDEAIADLTQSIALNRNAQHPWGSENELLGHAVLADCYWQKRDFSKAASEYNQVVSLNGATLEHRERLGIAQYKSGAMDDALSNLNTAIEAGSKNAEVFVCRGFILKGKSQHEEAIKSFDRTIALGQDTAAIRLNRGLCRQAAGRAEEALADLKRAAEMESQSSEYAAALGVMLYELKHLDEAEQTLTRAIKLDSRCRLAYQYRAYVHVLKNRNAQAKSDYGRVLELGNDAAIRNAFAETMYLLGEYKGALPQVERAIADGDGSDRAKAVRGCCYYQLGEYAKAVADFDEALKSTSTHLGCNLRLLRGHCYVHLKQDEAALKDYNQVLSEVQDAEGLARRGMLHQKAGRKDQALKDLNAAIAANANCGWFYQYRAQVHKDAKRYQDALSDCMKAVQLTPKKDDHLFHLRAEVYRALNQGDLALVDIDQAIQLNPKGEYYSFRAGQHLVAKAFDKAIADYTRAIDLNGGDWADYALRAKAYEATGRKDLARKDQSMAQVQMAVMMAPALSDDQVMECLNKALELDSANAKACLIRARLHLKAKNQAAALKDAESLVQLEPTHQEGWRIIGDIHLSRDDAPKAVVAYTKAIAAGAADADLFLSRGMMLMKLDKCQEAVADLGQAIEDKNFGETARLLRGRCYKQLDQRKEAIADLAAVSETTSDGDLLESLLLELGQLEAYKEAARAGDRLAQQRPRDAQASSLAAAMHFKAGAPRQALAAFKRAYEIEQSEDNLTMLSGCYVAVADASLEAHDYTAAITILDEALKTCGQMPNLYAARGSIHFTMLASYTNAVPKSLTPSQYQTFKKTCREMAQLALDDLRAYLRLSPQGPKREAVQTKIAELEKAMRVWQSD